MRPAYSARGVHCGYCETTWLAPTVAAIKPVLEVFTEADAEGNEFDAGYWGKPCPQCDEYLPCSAGIRRG